MIVYNIKCDLCGLDTWLTEEDYLFALCPQCGESGVEVLEYNRNPIGETNDTNGTNQ